MKLSGKTIGITLMLILLIGGSIFAAKSAGLMSVITSDTIGDERFTPYDILTFSNSFDRTKWIDMAGARTCVTFQGQEKCVDEYQGAYGADGMFCTSPTIKDVDHEFRTRNLRLEDAKFTFLTKDFDNGRYGGSACISTNVNGELFCIGRKSYTSFLGQVTESVEVRWDNAELGHYQIFRDGEKIAEGTVPEGQEFYFKTRAKSQRGFDYEQATACIKDLRTARVFGCELQEGQVKASITLDKAGIYSLSDLRGLEQFCPAFEQLNCINGVCGNRNRIIYNLTSADGSIIIKDNEFWEIQYLADRQTLGVTDAVCELWDVDQAKCTGKVDLCNEEQMQPGVGCVSLQADLEDIPVDKPAIGQQKITWTSSERFDGKIIRQKDSLVSGSSDFMTVQFAIDEATCPYDGETKRYPEDPSLKNCFTLTAFDSQFKEGDSKTFGGLNVKLDKLTARYAADDDGKSYTYAAVWALTFQPDAVKIDSISVPTTQQGENQYVGVPIQNTLPADGTFEFLARTTKSITGAQEISIKGVQLGQDEQATVAVKVPSDTVGIQKLEIIPLLSTEYGSVAFASQQTTYVVMNEELESVIDDIKNHGGDINVYDLTPEEQAAVLANANAEPMSTKNKWVLGFALVFIIVLATLWKMRR